MIKKTKDTTIPKPEDPPKDCNITQIKILKKQVSSYVKRPEVYQENKSKLYAVIWGQYSGMIQTQIKALKADDDLFKDSDSFKLLKEIKGISYYFETCDNLYLSMHDAKVTFYTNKTLVCLRGGVLGSNEYYLGRDLSVKDACTGRTQSEIDSVLGL